VPAQAEAGVERRARQPACAARPRPGAVRPCGRIPGGEAFDAAGLVGGRAGRQLRAFAAAAPGRSGRQHLGRQLHSGLFGNHLAAFDQRAVLRQPPMRLHVAVAIGVEDAKLDRVHADRLGDLVHMGLDGEIHTGDAEAAHCGGRRAVRVDAIDVGRDVGDRVGARQVADALDHRVGRQPRIGAAIEIAGELARHDTAVAHHRVLEIPALGPARGADLHLLLAVPHVFAGPPCQHRAEDGQRLVNRIDLAAETATHRAADEMQPG
jgi:hypothetical protein